ncbi:MAG TPA: ATPase domain-containing protein [Actinomycetota bacterium]|nr:ATPase domain-containing protein [Actinomycetota bacterium]
MGKVRQVLACSACGQQVAQWVGRCPGCGAWGTVGEATPAVVHGERAEIHSLTLPAEEPDRRLRTGFDGVDRVLGGGLVPGSVVLLAGEPGIGKSTLVLQVVAHLAAAGEVCLVASGEETRSQVSARARRLGIDAAPASFVAGRDLPAVVDAARASRSSVLVVDSIQSIRDPSSTSLPGGPAQVRACADALISLAKGEGIAVILVGQVTKDGDVAGPRTLEHAVDMVCSFDADDAAGLRVLAGGKNRFGPEGELAWFEMAPDGLREVDPARVFAPSEAEPGAATALVSAGRRALALEVQALAVPTDGPARRHVSGLDPRRFGLVAAVVDRTAGLRLSRSELYGAAAGGVRVDDPGIDLAVAAALASSVAGVAPPPRTAFVGEVSLTGTVRPASTLGMRLAAAQAAGVETVVCAGDASPPRGLRVMRVRRVEEALRWGGARRTRRGKPVPDEAPTPPPAVPAPA